MHIEELTRKYSKFSSLKEAKIGWEDDYEASSKHVYIPQVISRNCNR
jgi:hypothetical protein